LEDCIPNDSRGPDSPASDPVRKQARFPKSAAWSLILVLLVLALFAIVGQPQEFID
jgi:hypothetical protein